MERLLPPRPSSSNSCEGEQRFRMERYSFPLIALLIFSSAQRSGVRWDLPTGGRSTRWKKTLHCHHDHDGDGHGHDNHDNDGDDDYDDHGHDDYEDCDYHDDHDEHNGHVKLQVKVSKDKWDGKPIWIAGLCYPRPRDGRLSPLLVPFLSLVASHIIIIIIVLKIAIINILLYPRYLISTICGPSCPPSPDVVVDILFWIGEYLTNNFNR